MVEDKPRAEGGQGAETPQHRWGEGGDSGKLLQRGYGWAVWGSLRWLETGKWRATGGHREGEERDSHQSLGFQAADRFAVLPVSGGPSLKGSEQETEVGQAHVGNSFAMI